MASIVKYKKVQVPNKYWNVIKKYLNPKLEICPLDPQNKRGYTVPANDLIVISAKNMDIPEFATDWALTNAHIKDMMVIPMRTLVQNGIHSTFSRDAVKNAITGYSTKTEEKMLEDSKFATINSAQKFYSCKFEKGKCVDYKVKGALIIPYFTPSKEHTEEDFQKTKETLGMPNFTVRTNSSGMKYARMATNTYNAVEDKKVLPRMPYVLFSNLTDETRNVADAMLLDDITEESIAVKTAKGANLPSEVVQAERARACKILDDLKQNTPVGAKPPIYIIEGEKKALALHAAVEAQYEAYILNKLNPNAFPAPKSTPKPIEVLGISGVWQTVSKKLELQPDLKECVDFTDRDIVIVYDNDIVKNHNISNAIACLAPALKNAGAKSVSMFYPSVPAICQGAEDQCKGFDDTVYEAAKVIAGAKPQMSLADRRAAYLETLNNIFENIVLIKTVGKNFEDIQQDIRGIRENPESMLKYIADAPALKEKEVKIISI